jgi:hypothetical protein
MFQFFASNVDAVSEREVGETSIFAAFKDSVNGILQRLNHYEYLIEC